MRQLGLMRWGALEAVRSLGRWGAVAAALAFALCLYVGHELRGERLIFLQAALAVGAGWVSGLLPISGAALPDPRSRGWAAWGGVLTLTALAAAFALAFALALGHALPHDTMGPGCAGVAAVVVLVGTSLRLLTRSAWIALLLGLPMAGYLASRVASLERLAFGSAGAGEDDVLLGTMAASVALCALSCVLRPPRRSGAEEA